MRVKIDGAELFRLRARHLTDITSSHVRCACTVIALKELLIHHLCTGPVRGGPRFTELEHRIEISARDTNDGLEIV